MTKREECRQLLETRSKETEIITMDPYKIQFWFLRRIGGGYYRFYRFSPQDASNTEAIVSGELFSQKGKSLKLSEEGMKENFPEKVLKDLKETSMMFTMPKEDGKQKFIVPDMSFISTFIKMLSLHGTLFKTLKSFNKVLFIAEAFAKHQNAIKLVIRKMGGVYTAMAAVSDRYQSVDPLETFESVDKVAEEHGMEFHSYETCLGIVRFIYTFKDEGKDEKLSHFKKGIQIVLSDNTDSSTTLRTVLVAGDQNIAYLTTKRYPHRTEFKEEYILSAIKEAKKSDILNNVLKIKRRHQPKNPLKVFEKILKDTGLDVAIGDKKTSQVIENAKDNFAWLYQQRNRCGYDDVLVEYLSIQKEKYFEKEFRDSTAEKVRNSASDVVKLLRK